MSKQYEVVAVTGKYTDRDGNEKSRYMTIGVVIQTKNGLMLKMEANPVGWDGWAYLNEPKPKEDQRTHGQMKRGAQADDMDSPPF